MKLENIFLLLITTLFLSFSVRAENPNNWITYYDDASLLIEYQYQNCEYDRFDDDIPIKEEMIVEIKAKPFDEQPEMTSDEIIKGEVEYSQWQDRDGIWWESR